MLNSPEVLGIFAYTIHAFFWWYKNSYAMKNKKLQIIDNIKNFKDVFSICIYGKDKFARNTVANLLTNIFEVDVDDISSIYVENSISFDKTHPEKDINYSWQSVPIMVFSDKKTITTRSSVVDRLQDLREKRTIFFFPVYVNSKPLNADIICNFCADNILNFLPEDKEINFLKEQINYLLLSFVSYLADLSTSEYNLGDFNYMTRIYTTTISELSQKKGYKLNKKNPEKLLHAAIKGFCYFLEEKMQFRAEANLMEQKSYQIFVPPIEKRSNNTGANEELSPSLTVFCEYLQGLSCLGDVEKPLWFFDNHQEETGELCWLIVNRSFYQDFSEFLKLRKKQPIKKIELQRELKRQNCLITYERKQYGISRKHPSFEKPTTCMVIIKNELLKYSR